MENVQEQVRERHRPKWKEIKFVEGKGCSRGRICRNDHGYFRHENAMRSKVGIRAH